MHKMFIAMLGILIVVALVQAEEFIIKRPQQTKKSDMRLECAHCLNNGLHAIASIMQKSAALLEGGLCMGETMLEDRFFSAMNKQELSSAHKEFQEFYKRQCTILDLLEQQKDFIKKYSA